MTGPSAELIRLTRSDSTMDVLHQLALEGAPAGSVVVAEEQGEGRGSRGRAWLSPRGGLWLSLLFRPPAPAGLELLSLRAGLAVADSLESLGVAGPIRLKWPNDLMLGERKLGGILSEARWQGDRVGWVVVGLGLNVVNPVPHALRLVATNLVTQAPGLTPEALVLPVAAALRRVDTGAGALTPDEQARFAARDWLRGRALRAPRAGHAAGIAGDGALLVRLPSGAIAAARAGTVELADTSPTA